MAGLRFQDRMSDSDALMWTTEKDPMLRSTITAISVLDRAPDVERLTHLLERGTRLVPRMRQRVRANPLSVAPPRWEVDPHFDLSYHLRWCAPAATGTSGRCSTWPSPWPWPASTALARCGRCSSSPTWPMVAPPWS